MAIKNCIDRPHITALLRVGRKVEAEQALYYPGCIAAYYYGIDVSANAVQFWWQKRLGFRRSTGDNSSARQMMSDPDDTNDDGIKSIILQEVDEASDLYGVVLLALDVGQSDRG